VILGQASTRQASTPIHSPLPGNPRRAVAWVALTILLTDQFSKTLVVTLLGSQAHATVGWLSLQLVRNTGASFGVEGRHRLFMTALAILVTAGVAVLAIRTQKRTAALAWAVTLGGALGNLADRLARSPALGRGAVIDWIHVGGYPATFNIADLAIRGGSLFAFVRTVRPASSHPHTRSHQPITTAARRADTEGSSRCT
jgi:signal peptidase II